MMIEQILEKALSESGIFVAYLIFEKLVLFKGLSKSLNGLKEAIEGCPFNKKR